MTTCERYAELDSAERYVAGRMAADEAAEFEQHFLACDACLSTVRGVEDVRDALDERRAAIGQGKVDLLVAARAADAPVEANRRKQSAGPWMPAAWLALAAALMAGVFWMSSRIASRSSSPESSASSGASTPAVAREAQPAPEPSTNPSAEANQTPPATASSSQPPSSTSSPSGTPSQPAPPVPPPGTPTTLIGRLAIVVPPPYVAVPVRGEGDDVRQAFAAAMTKYRAKDYAGAAAGLRAVVAKSKDLASAQFYLGICELMLRQPRRAETALRAAADSEITPYADEAYFYLAKAALQREDLTAAERALIEAVAREAGPGDDARVLLEDVRALGRS